MANLRIMVSLLMVSVVNKIRTALKVNEEEEKNILVPRENRIHI